MKRLPSFTKQLTNYYYRRELKQVIAQLEKYGDKEDVDFVVKEQGSKCAVFINKMADNAVKIVGMYKKSFGYSPTFKKFAVRIRRRIYKKGNNGTR